MDRRARLILALAALAVLACANAQVHYGPLGVCALLMTGPLVGRCDAKLDTSVYAPTAGMGCVQWAGTDSALSLCRMMMGRAHTIPIPTMLALRLLLLRPLLLPHRPCPSRRRKNRPAHHPGGLQHRHKSISSNRVVAAPSSPARMSHSVVFRFVASVAGCRQLQRAFPLDQAAAGGSAG
jgi:hypothetical protein